MEEGHIHLTEAHMVPQRVEVHYNSKVEVELVDYHTPSLGLDMERKLEEGERSYLMGAVRIQERVVFH
jgi:hypothetical protein